MQDIVAGSGTSTGEFHEQLAAPSLGHSPTDQGTYGVTSMPTEGAPTDSGTVGESLFPIDPMLYGDMMFNFGYASAITSRAGPQTSGGPPGNGSSGNPLGQRWSGPEPQAQRQQFDYPSASHGDGGKGIVPNPDGLPMWTNVPYGFE